VLIGNWLLPFGWTCCFFLQAAECELLCRKISSACDVMKHKNVASRCLTAGSHADNQECDDLPPCDISAVCICSLSFSPFSHTFAVNCTQAVTVWLYWQPSSSIFVFIVRHSLTALRQATYRLHCQYRGLWPIS
jgi:hypothetical protein